MNPRQSTPHSVFDKPVELHWRWSDRIQRRLEPGILWSWAQHPNHGSPWHCWLHSLATIWSLVTRSGPQNILDEWLHGRHSKKGRLASLTLPLLFPGRERQPGEMLWPILDVLILIIINVNRWRYLLQQSLSMDRIPLV
jgi:hypothetical protein